MSFLITIATNIDALAVGASFVLLNFTVFILSVIIALISFVHFLQSYLDAALADSSETRPRSSGQSFYYS
jgi:putative Mn2+ efflux pump MntP